MLRQRGAEGGYQLLCLQQFWFYRQWNRLKKYANDRGIKIIGDLPIYVAFDGADAWANPDLFQFDEEATPAAVAGCPPDAFFRNWSLWEIHFIIGNIIRKQVITGGSCMTHCMKLYDKVRIRSFRGFDVSTGQFLWR